jgi:plastocyanin
VSADVNRLLRLALAAMVAILAVAACSSEDGSTASGSSSAPAAATTTSAPAAKTSVPAGGESGSAGAQTGAGGGTITIKDFKFGAPLMVKPGATIEVVNQDTAAHDVVSDDAGKFKTPSLGQGEKATFTAPAEPGTYKFSCSLHPASMSGTGTLVVEG